MEHKNTFSITHAIKYGFNAFLTHWKILAQVWALLMGIIVVPFTILAVFGIISFTMLPGLFSSVASGSATSVLQQSSENIAASSTVQTLSVSWQTMSPAAIGISLLGLLLLMFVMMGIGIAVNLVNTHIVLKLHDTGVASWRDIFAIKPFIFTAAIAGILMFLGAVGGMLLFIIPGLYLMLHWMFYLWAVVDKKGTATECLKYSYSIVQGNAWRVLGLLAAIGFISIPVGLLSKVHQVGVQSFPVTLVLALLTIIGQIILSGVSAFAFTYVYRTLSDAYEKKNVTQNPVVEQQEAPQVQDAQEVSSEEQSVSLREKEPIENTTGVENIEDDSVENS